MNDQGEIKLATPENDYFKKLVGGFGQHAAIIDVTLQCVPNVRYTLKSQITQLDNYLNDFDSRISKDEKIGMHLVRLPIFGMKDWGNGCSTVRAIRR